MATLSHSYLSPLSTSSSHSLSSPSKLPPPSYRSQWWTSGLFILLSHLLHIYLFFSPYPHSPSYLTLSFTLLLSYLNLLGITLCYHRLYSHRSYHPHTIVRIALLIIGSMSFQGSAKWWALKHRLHHRYTDSDGDPHSSKEGMWWCHMGWLLWPPGRGVEDRVHMIDMRDLKSDRWVKWQSKNILYLYIIMGVLLPGLLGKYTENNFLMGVIYIGSLSRIISWHCIWSINSVSHFDFQKWIMGGKEENQNGNHGGGKDNNNNNNNNNNENNKDIHSTHPSSLTSIETFTSLHHTLSNTFPFPHLSLFLSSLRLSLSSLIRSTPLLHLTGHQEYSLLSSATHYPFISLLQNGEGHHNYHHEFPMDYRHGIRWYDYDPTKWAINVLDYMGLVEWKVIVDKGVVMRARERVGEEKRRRWRLMREKGEDYAYLYRDKSTKIKLRLPVSSTSSSFISDSLLPSYTLSSYYSHFLPLHPTTLLILPYIIDYGDFARAGGHPGGDDILGRWRGKIANREFYGGMNQHTESAVEIMRGMVIGKIVEMEEDKDKGEGKEEMNKGVEGEEEKKVEGKTQKENESDKSTERASKQEKKEEEKNSIPMEIESTEKCKEKEKKSDGGKRKRQTK